MAALLLAKWMRHQQNDKWSCVWCQFQTVFEMYILPRQARVSPGGGGRVGAGFLAAAAAAAVEVVAAGVVDRGGAGAVVVAGEGEGLGAVVNGRWKEESWW